MITKVQKVQDQMHILLIQQKLQQFMEQQHMVQQLMVVQHNH